jgi:hypothetical protein
MDLKMRKEKIIYLIAQMGEEELKVIEKLLLVEEKLKENVTESNRNSNMFVLPPGYE